MYQKTGTGFTAISFLVIFVAVSVIGGIFYWLYGEARENIINVWQTHTMQTTQDVGYYLSTPMDAVAFTALKVNGMMGSGVSNAEIGRYLINESEIYELIIEGNETGIYGYCRGEYLDGSGWVPDADYEPKKRPWYKRAWIAGGETVLVEPYRNLQTNSMMMSVSQLLDDGDSVVSMDIFLGNIQKTVEEIVAKHDVEMAMVIQRRGVVLAHSDESEVGRDYGDGSSAFGALLVEHLETAGREMFEISNEDRQYMAFVEPVNEDWYVVLMLDENKIFRSLQSIYLFSALTMLLVLGGIIFGFYSMSRKQAEAERLDREVHAVADIYAAMMMLDFRTDEIRVLRTVLSLDTLLNEGASGFSSRLLPWTEKISSDQSRHLMVGFMDPATLEERLAGVNSISHEFLDQRDCWMRVRFIVVDRDTEGHLQRVILAFESIDEDRKQQERLRELSEMDMMTGIRNRGSGEALVRKKMADGTKGMFCLLDADKFKTINDTYGHAVGDKVIIAIADCLQTTFRDSDVVFRLGGDEFAVFAEGVNDTEIAENIMERLFCNLGKITIPELGERKICVSAGGTFYPANRNDSFEALYARSDAGLYESKKTEGSHVTFRLQQVSAPPPEDEEGGAV